MRAFCFGDGDFRVNAGPRTPEEVTLGVGVPDDEQPPDEEDVLKVAEQWGINPLDLGDQPTYGTGLLGRKERRR